MTEIDGTVALVTGGQRGLGRAFAAGLLERGAERVYVTARTPVSEEDPRLVPLALDVADEDSVAALADQVGEVDIVFNNAGVMFPTPLLRVSLAEIRATFETNVFGALTIAQTFAPTLAARGGGVLVDIHSVLSWGSGAGAYGASKAALWSVTNSLRVELESQGTQVVGVHLGFADTEMVAAMPGDKMPASQVAEVVLEGVEKGETEILVDDASRAVKAALAGPVDGLVLMRPGR